MKLGNTANRTDFGTIQTHQNSYRNDSRLTKGNDVKLYDMADRVADIGTVLNNVESYIPEGNHGSIFMTQ